MSTTVAHNDVRRLVELAHYEDHDKRTESSAFRHIKAQLHKEHAQCYIGNKYCEGNIEIHHKVIEWSAATEVDFEKVMKDFPTINDPDTMENMMPLCAKHHRGKFHGIHVMTYPIWVLQRYMTEEALDKFEAAIQEEIKKEGN